MKTETFSGYLILSKGPYSYSNMSGRMTIKEPSLKQGEVAVKIKVRVPEILFKRPALQAEIVIPEDKVPQHIIDASVADNVEELVKEQLGMNIKVTLEQPEDQPK